MVFAHDLRQQGQSAAQVVATLFAKQQPVMTT
jgi:hypothetical protein